MALDSSGKSLTTPFGCDKEVTDKSAANDFMSQVKRTVDSGSYTVMQDKSLLTYPLEMKVEAKNSSFAMEIGTWKTDGGFKKASGYEHSEIPRFFKIGTVPTTPWAFYELDARGMVIKDKNGNPKLQGYCIEMIEEMARRMYFDYEIVLPSDNSEDYGKKKPSGEWSGVIGKSMGSECHPIFIIKQNDGISR